MANGTSNGSSTIFALVMLGTVACFILGGVIAVVADPKDAGIIIAAFFGGLGVTLPLLASFLTGLNTAKLAQENSKRLDVVQETTATVAHKMDGLLEQRVQGAENKGQLDEIIAQREREAAAAAAADITTTTTSKSTSPAVSTVADVPTVAVKEPTLVVPKVEEGGQ